MPRFFESCPSISTIASKVSSHAAAAVVGAGLGGGAETLGSLIQAARYVNSDPHMGFILLPLAVSVSPLMFAQGAIKGAYAGLTNGFTASLDKASEIHSSYCPPTAEEERLPNVHYRKRK